MVKTEGHRRKTRLDRLISPYFAAGAILLVIAVTSACSPAPTQPPMTAVKSPAPATLSQPAGATIEWAFWGDPWEIEINERLINVFRTDNPQIQVKIRSTSWSDFFPQAEQWLAGDSAPDIMFFDFVPVYASKGMLQDLTPYIEKDKYDLSDFYSGLLQYHTYNGHLYGLARDNDTKVIFYNKTLFNNAGVPFPKTGWTWQDLRDAAIKLTKKTGGQTTQYGFAYEPDEWWRLWVWQNGGEVYDNDFAPKKTLLDSPQSVEALQWLSDLTNVDGVTPPYDIQKTSLGIGELFGQGKLAMAFGNHALLPAFASGNSLKWDVVGLPQSKKRLNVAGGSGYVIPARAKNKDAAWLFLKWLESPKGQAIFTESGVIVPARRSVGRADIFLKQEPPHNATVFLEETELGRPNPMFSGVQQIASQFDEYLRPVWKGNMSARDAAAMLVPTINAAIGK